jgi:hypothetical protein
MSPNERSPREKKKAQKKDGKEHIGRRGAYMGKLFPGMEGKTGGFGRDNRQFTNSAFWILRTGLLFLVKAQFSGFYFFPPSSRFFQVTSRLGKLGQNAKWYSIGNLDALPRYFY